MTLPLQAGIIMTDKDFLDGKRVLIVDDEFDILESLEELLPTCDITKTASFNEAKELLETEHFDIAILDIMGVDGYELLKIATERKVTAVMLTAYALSPEDTVKSYKEGAAYYIPKEKMANITTFLKDVLEAKEKGKSPWWRWLERFASFYDKRFGPDWMDTDKDFWKKFNHFV